MLILLRASEASLAGQGPVGVGDKNDAPGDVDVSCQTKRNGGCSWRSGPKVERCLAQRQARPRGCHMGACCLLPVRLTSTRLFLPRPLRKSRTGVAPSFTLQCLTLQTNKSFQRYNTLQDFYNKARKSPVISWIRITPATCHQR